MNALKKAKEYKSIDCAGVVRVCAGKIGKPLGTNLGTNQGLTISEVLQTKARIGRAGGI